MSFFPVGPRAGRRAGERLDQQVIVPRSVDLGDVTCTARCPSARSRMVGPFILFDHFGPAVFSPAKASMCGRTRISGSPRSPICSTARSCIATVSALRCRSAPRGQLDDGGRGIVHPSAPRPITAMAMKPLHGLQLGSAVEQDEETHAGVCSHGGGRYSGVARRTVSAFAASPGRMHVAAHRSVRHPGTPSSPTLI